MQQFQCNGCNGFVKTTCGETAADCSAITTDHGRQAADEHAEILEEELVAMSALSGSAQQRGIQEQSPCARNPSDQGADRDREGGAESKLVYQDAAVPRGGKDPVGYRATSHCMQFDDGHNADGNWNGSLLRPWRKRHATAGQTHAEMRAPDVVSGDLAGRATDLGTPGHVASAIVAAVTINGARFLRAILRAHPARQGRAPSCGDGGSTGSSGCDHRRTPEKRMRSGDPASSKELMAGLGSPCAMTACRRQGERRNRSRRLASAVAVARNLLMALRFTQSVVRLSRREESCEPGRHDNRRA